MTDRRQANGLRSVTPFFIVGDLQTSLRYYQDALGFDVVHVAPAGDAQPFFAIVQRDGVRFMLKEIAPDVTPLPNSQRHEWAPWDAFVHTPNPDSLAEELEELGVAFRTPLGNTEDGLRGFAIEDADGYVLFFGRTDADGSSG